MNKLILSTLIIGITTTPCLFSQQYFSEDFESQTTGNQPTATAVRPTTNEIDNYVEVVSGSDNYAGGGSGKGVRTFDNNSGSSFSYENNFVADSGSQLSSLHLSFNLAWNQTANTDGDYARFGIAAYDASTGAIINQGSNNFFELRLQNDGIFYATGGGGNASTNLTDDVAANVDLFVNDSDSASINYAAPNGGGNLLLAANSFAVYVDNSLLITDTLENGALSGDNNLGRFGVVSFGSFTGVDYTFDNFSVSAIPEPSTYAMFMGLATAACLVIRRRNRQ